MSDPSDVRVSGAALLDQRRVIEELLGPELVLRAIAALPPEARDEYRAMSAISWVRISTSSAFFDHVLRESGRTEDDLLPIVVRRATERTLTTVWRMFLRFTGDHALIGRFASLYQRSWDRGRLEARFPTRGRADLVLSEWPDPHDRSVRTLALAIETVLTLAGRERVRVSHEPRRDGAVFVATWRA